MEILGRILESLLVFPGKAVHAVSRFDPCYLPPIETLVARGKTGIGANGANLRLMHRFCIGTGRFSLTYADKPNDLLAPLLVCREWHYIGANLFYSLNKFCFSSLGE